MIMSREKEVKSFSVCLGVFLKLAAERTRVGALKTQVFGEQSYVSVV